MGMGDAEKNDVELFDKLIGILFEDMPDEDEFYNKKPLLAHYTSIDALEKILRTDEIWFSNPLYMNDLEEIRFGILKGQQYFLESTVIKDALGSSERQQLFYDSFDLYFTEYLDKHAFDSYVFCFSEHKLDKPDGLLSMWRGYGGNGNGAAIVLDAAKIEPMEYSPLIFRPVIYGSYNKRTAWFEKCASKLANILICQNIPDDKIYLTSAALFDRLKVFALLSKHDGFDEEDEWRLVYMADWDHDGRLKTMLDYSCENNSIQPKLKFKVTHIDGVTSQDLSLSKIMHSILLGPCGSSPLNTASVGRMLEKIGKPELKKLLVASSIPFRSN